MSVKRCCHPRPLSPFTDKSSLVVRATSFYFENVKTGSIIFNCNSTRKSLNAQYGLTFRSVVVGSNSFLTQHRCRGFTACADLHDVRTRTRSRTRTRLRLRGGTRARGEGPGIRAVPAHRHGEAAVSEREPRRRREAGVQAVGPAKREGQGNRCTESRSRSTRLSLRRSHAAVVCGVSVTVHFCFLTGQTNKIQHRRLR